MTQGKEDRPADAEPPSIPARPEPEGPAESPEKSPLESVEGAEKRSK